MERLVHYYLHLHRLLINFVNFSEFYDEEKSAAFQSGSLYIDGRSCHLCIPAGDIEAHSSVAKDSQIFLLYCECSRGQREGEDPESKNIVAAVTAGDADLLVQNRNGVYVDPQGKDWDAKVVKVVSNPINLWQAVLSPYKKVGGMITEQISKYASDKQASLMDSAGKSIDDAATKVAAGTAPKFDISRNVGMFAAVGLALGAIGTAVGSIFNALLSMTWWQLPLLMVGLFVLISGPAVLLAWLKLRQRTLGPLLEASGWAINGRAALTGAVADRLSSTAVLPPNSHRSTLDPIVQMKRLRRSAFWIAVGVGILGALGFLMYKEYMHEKETGQLAKMMTEIQEAAVPEEEKAEADKGESAEAETATEDAPAEEEKPVEEENPAEE